MFERNLFFDPKSKKFTDYLAELHERSINSRQIIVWFRDEEMFDSSSYFWCNQHMANKLGIDRNEQGLILTKDYYKTFVLDDEGKQMLEDLKLASKKIREDEEETCSRYIVKLKNQKTNEVYYIDFVLEVFERYPDGCIKTWGGNGIDISDAYKRNKDVEYLASHDSIMGIYNRRSLFDNIKKLWLQCMRDKTSLSFIMIDVDNFKLYNDDFGHVKGDQVLINIANQLSKSIRRPFDILGRYGGEEFLVVLPNTDIEGAYNVAEKMRKRVRRLRIEHSSECDKKYLTISLGISTVIPKTESSLEQAIEDADKALFESKRKGKNRTERFDKLSG